MKQEELLCTTQQAQSPQKCDSDGLQVWRYGQLLGDFFSVFDKYILVEHAYFPCHLRNNHPIGGPTGLSFFVFL